MTERCRQHFLYFLSEPQGHQSFLPVLGVAVSGIGRVSSTKEKREIRPADIAFSIFLRRRFGDLLCFHSSVFVMTRSFASLPT